MKTHNVKTISGLQAMLTEGVSALTGLEKRDLNWARAMIGAVNCGGSLLRTDVLISGKSKRAK